MSRPRKSISKRKSSKRSKNKTKNSKSIDKVNSIRNEIYPTGGKTHVKKHTIYGKSGTSIRITNSYMNKKGIVRHTRTKNVSPYTRSL
jgi:hypothetical protein